MHLKVHEFLSGGTLLTKMSAELPSAEQIFTETSRLVPLITRRPLRLIGRVLFEYSPRAYVLLPGWRCVAL